FLLGELLDEEAVAPLPLTGRAPGPHPDLPRGAWSDREDGGEEGDLVGRREPHLAAFVVFPEEGEDLEADFAVSLVAQSKDAARLPIQIQASRADIHHRVRRKCGSHDMFVGASRRPGSDGQSPDSLSIARL